MQQTLANKEERFPNKKFFQKNRPQSGIIKYPTEEDSFYPISKLTSAPSPRLNLILASNFFKKKRPQSCRNIVTPAQSFESERITGKGFPNANNSFKTIHVKTPVFKKNLPSKSNLKIWINQLESNSMLHILETL